MIHEFDKIPIEQKTGFEPLTFNNLDTNFMLSDFWKWSVSDLISNATRGRFAEFIVASALEIDMTSIRDEWSPYDLITPEGIKVEVKSAMQLLQILLLKATLFRLGPILIQLIINPLLTLIMLKIQFGCCKTTLLQLG